MIPTSGDGLSQRAANVFQRIPKPLRYSLMIAIIGGVFSGLVEQYQIPYFPPSAWLDNTFIVMATAEMYRQMVPYIAGEGITLPKSLSLIVGFYVAVVGYLPITTQQGSVALYPAGTFIMFYSIKERGEYSPIEVTMLGALLVISTTTILRTLIYLSAADYLNSTLAEMLLLTVILFLSVGLVMASYGIYQSEITDLHISLYGVFIVFSAGSFISMGQLLYDWGYLIGWANIFAVIIVIVYILVGFMMMLYIPYKTIRVLWNSFKHSISQWIN